MEVAACTATSAMPQSPVRQTRSLTQTEFSEASILAFVETFAVLFKTTRKTATLPSTAPDAVPIFPETTNETFAEIADLMDRKVCITGANAEKRIVLLEMVISARFEMSPKNTRIAIELAVGVYWKVLLWRVMFAPTSSNIPNSRMQSVAEPVKTLSMTARDCKGAAPESN